METLWTVLLLAVWFYFCFLLGAVITLVAHGIPIKPYLLTLRLGSYIDRYYRP